MNRFWIRPTPGRLAMALGALVCVHRANSQTAWKTATDGNWTNGANWTVGVPDNTEARLNAVGASYTTTWTGGGAPFLSLVVTNAGSDTTTLNLNAPGFVNSNGTIRLGRGARVNVTTGGEWRYAGTNTTASPLAAIDHGAELRIDGGSLIFTNITGTTAAHASFQLGTTAGSTGSVYISNGRLDFRNKSSSGSGFFVGHGNGAHGQVHQSGGEVVIERDAGGDQYDFRIASATGASGEYHISGGTLSLTGYPTVANSANSRGVLRISQDGVVNNTGQKFDFGIGTGSRGELNVSGNGAFLSPIRLITFGYRTGTGVLHMASGTIVARSLFLGNNAIANTTSVGNGRIEGGTVTISGSGPGMVVGRIFDLANQNNLHALGDLTMTDGLLDIANVGQDGYTPLAGLVLGLTRSDNVSGSARGEFHLAGGVVTNRNTSAFYGYLVLGYNPGATGIMTQTGGRYTQTGTRPALVGYGGGVGELVVSNGVFELTGANASMYVGGYVENANVFRYNATTTNVDEYAGTGPSTGRVTVAGGTMTVPGSVVLSQVGSGTLTIGKAGTLTAQNIDLTNGVATLRYEFGDDGIGLCKATGEMRIGPNSKLHIDATEAMRGGTYLLAECGSRTGDFVIANITVVGGDPAWVDQDTDQNIHFRIPTGTILMLR